MSIRFSNLIATLILCASSSVLTFVPKASADLFRPDPIPFNPRTTGIDELFNRTFFSNDKEAFTNRSIERQFNFLFGPYPENEINRDARAVHKLYVDVLRQQTSQDPILRTPDLPNPYNSSLFQLGTFNVNTPVRGSEFIYEQQPPR